MPKEGLREGANDEGLDTDGLRPEDLGAEPEKRGDEHRGRNVFLGEEAERMQAAREAGEYIPGRYTPPQWVKDESGNRKLEPARWEARPRGLAERTSEEQLRLFQEAINRRLEEQDLGWNRVIPDEPFVPRRVYGGDDRHPYGVKDDPRNPR